jgi:hypothetical protein
MQETCSGACTQARQQEATGKVQMDHSTSPFSVGLLWTLGHPPVHVQDPNRISIPACRCRKDNP